MPVSASILTPLYVVFAWVMQGLYAFFNNYGLVIILFTVIIRGVLVPLGIKQHKTTLMMQALAPQVDDLKRIYGKDRQGLQQATMELYRKNKVSQVGGCLPSILMIFIIWPIYRMVSAPLHWIANVAESSIASIGSYLQSVGQMTEAQVQNIGVMDLPVLSALHDHPDSLVQVVQNGWMKTQDMIDLNFLGMNLGVVPTYKPSLLFGDEMSTYLPLLIIPILTLITSFLVAQVTEWTNPSYKKIREGKKLAKKNPARTEPTDMSQQGMMKGMKYTMPLFTLFIVFSMPAAMGLYFIIGNLMAILQSVILYALYSKKELA